ncbi:hypothetical protein NLX67_17495 [Domibacillus sp. A3M-37]|uniref:hypothetical protein n=1 Tax=Domibacillus sp. A3M-37 TaxID=2962037 RepID=UPI0020B7120F|nr:hypothetical protein [Domibacillus sp. A3M-37]MCP3764147.1 hypothetical protein [Domibacillus sp. A3M-37]
MFWVLNAAQTIILTIMGMFLWYHVNPLCEQYRAKRILWLQSEVDEIFLDRGQLILI